MSHYAHSHTGARDRVLTVDSRAVGTPFPHQISLTPKFPTAPKATLRNYKFWWMARPQNRAITLHAVGLCAVEVLTAQRSQVSLFLPLDVAGLEDTTAVATCKRTRRKAGSRCACSSGKRPSFLVRIQICGGCARFLSSISLAICFMGQQLECGTLPRVRGC